MWQELFKFELRYRARRPETYVFFGFLLLFSIVGVDFIFQGVELGLMKKNAPLVIAKTMGAITGIFMILVSMIMGVPVLRDYQYDTEALLFVNPVSKRDYLLGRFLGSFVVLLFIFSSLPLGMMLGAQMPWHKAKEMLAFDALAYLQPFAVVVLPTLFFGACVFFTTGMLSKKLLIVYTQGIVLFVVFLLTKAITHEYLQGLLDPFSLTTLTQYAKDWTVPERNAFGISLSGILLHSKLLWVGLGGTVLFVGYRKFSLSLLSQKPMRKAKKAEAIVDKGLTEELPIPKASPQHQLKAGFLQLLELSKFYTRSLLKETAFWAIVICGMIIILINSVNLGTVYEVDSYPATHFIIAELQEMSMYFFIIILLFYSGELIWKERNINQYLLNDATPIDGLITLSAKFFALLSIYVVLMISLIAAGVLFQAANGYYLFELDVYFAGFFIEILPFLLLYTLVAFFLQSISPNKFIGIFLTLIFFIGSVGSELLGFNHPLYKFAGKPLGTYSDMNGYGHFLTPYLWVKAYWFVFAAILLLISALLMVRGTETSLWKRIKTLKHQITKPTWYALASLTLLFSLLGSYIFYNTNVLNAYWTAAEEQRFRADYEQTLKALEYFPQPKIIDTKLTVELYPASRSYEIDGIYTLRNSTNQPILEIHVQQFIASHVTLRDVQFEAAFAKAETEFAPFGYSVYRLSEALQPGDSLNMYFQQVYQPKGFEADGSNTELVYNGTFFKNSVLPTLGYNSKYELRDEDERAAVGLAPQSGKGAIDDPNELVNARRGSDSDGTRLEVTIGTSAAQTAVTSGRLLGQWTENDRNYFHYKSEQPIINFYSVVSAAYDVKRDHWTARDSSIQSVELEIYHHPDHAYNLDRMMAAMKASLGYFSTHFSSYQYQQLRIMEFPRYAEYAQSFPNAIPFSEAMGFVLDINDSTDVDMAFYITAHEVAHQWFGMQVEAANVQGHDFILETLSQYAATMVLKENYPAAKVQQFLASQQALYEEKRKRAMAEPSLALVGNEDFVYYYKGAIAMYKLQELIGEHNVNRAFKDFIEDWHSFTGEKRRKTNRYPTSYDLLEYFRAVTPADQQYLIEDLFETSESEVLSDQL